MDFFLPYFPESSEADEMVAGAASVRSGGGWTVVPAFMQPPRSPWADVLALVFFFAVLLVHAMFTFSAKFRAKFHWQTLHAICPSAFEWLAGTVWASLSLPGPMWMVYAAKFLRGWCRSALFSYRGHEKARGYVALTIDDAPGRGDHPLMAEVLDLLDRYGAKATFFVISSQFEGKEGMVQDVVKRGHELANHCVEDIKYHNHSEEEFEEALLSCEECIVQYAGPQRGGVKWFRPPQGRCSSAMQRVLARHRYTIAMCDCFGLDVVCGEPFVSSYLLRHARDGSIVLMHMPEKGFREHNLSAIEAVLSGFQARGIQCVSLSRLHSMAS